MIIQIHIVALNHTSFGGFRQQLVIQAIVEVGGSVIYGFAGALAQGIEPIACDSRFPLPYPNKTISVVEAVEWAEGRGPSLPAVLLTGQVIVLTGYRVFLTAYTTVLTGYGALLTTYIRVLTGYAPLLTGT